MFDFFLNQLARFRCWHKGYPDGLRDSIRLLPPHLMRKVWIEFVTQFPAALDAATSRPVIYRARDGTMVFGALHFAVRTDNFVFDYYMLRRRNGSLGDAVLVRELPWSDHKDEMEISADILL